MNFFETKDFGSEVKGKYLELMATSFSPEAVEKKRLVWDWLFGHPYVQSVGGATIVVMEKDGQWVGATLLTADQVVLEKEIYQACFPGGTCIRPESRGRNGFTFTRRILDCENVGVMMGMPSSERYALLYQRFGAHLTQKRFQRFKPLRFGRVAASRKPILSRLAPIGDMAGNLILSLQKIRDPRLQSGETITQEFSFSDDFEEFWVKAKENHDFCVVRNKDRMNWRYVDIPLNEYQIYFLRRDGHIIGYVVTSIREDDGKSVGHIIDIFLQNHELRDYHLLLSHAVERLREKNVDFSKISFLPHDILDLAARKAGFSALKESLRLNVGHVDKEGLDVIISRNVDNIYFHRGDHDEDY